MAANLDLEDGFALYFVLLLIIAVSIFVMTLYNGSFINIQLSQNLIYQKKAFYAADAAVVYAKVILERNKGIPTKTKRGEVYKIGDIYKEKEMYGGSKFKIRFVSVEQNPIKYKVKINSNYLNNICKISIVFNKQFQLIEYQK